MAIKRKILTEYITQIKENIPGTCIETKAEEIIRGYDCNYFSVPQLETEPILCLLHQTEVVPECYCCWAKRRPVLKEFKHGTEKIPKYR